MKGISRTRVIIASIGGLSLATAGVLAPSALAAESVDGDVKVSNTETVQVLMDAAGKIDAQRVYEQLVLTGKGNVDISNPVSSKGLRNLDGFGGFEERDGKVRVKTDVDGSKKYRSVSEFTKKLPIDVDVTYTLDGKKVEPGDVVGKSGNLEVRYLVTNTTGVSQDVVFQDGAGKEKSSPEEVVIPMVGSLTTTLPSSFEKVSSAEANAAGDGRGGTSLSFTMTLIPPIGKATAEFGYSAKVSDAVIPKANISALPVDPLQSPSFKGGAASYKGGATTGQDLTAGATEIDANVLKLRDGASDLVDGILQLADGANQLSAGLNNEAAPGAKKLADGAGKLDAGAAKLKGGTGDLGNGADLLNGGAKQISDGLVELNRGLKGTGTAADPGLVAALAQLSAGLSSLDGKLENDLKQAIVPLINGLLIPKIDASINDLTKTGPQNDPTTWGALQVLDTVVTIVDNVAATLPGADPRKALLGQAGQLSQGLRGKLNDNIGSGDPSNPTAGTGLKGLKAGLQAIAGGINAGVGLPGDPPKADGTPSSLRSGVAALKAGTEKIKGGAGDAVDGVGKLSKGAKDLKAGTDDLVAGVTKLNTGAGDLNEGTGLLSTGASTLADGLGTAATGSGKLSAGLDTAAESAPALPEGADRLSKEGTSKLMEAGDATASDYGLKYALIEAGSARAATAQPYGSPEGATALTAYKFELAGAEGADSANVTRGLAALALLVGAGVFATVRRRFS